MRPVLEVADIFRRHGEAFRVAQGSRLLPDQRRVMAAIEACRTAMLGGHVEQCDDCGQVRIAYNSCLMGKSINGELACRHQHFPVNCSDLCLHNSAVLRLHRLGHRWPITNGDEHVGDILLGIEDAEASTERAKRTIP